MITDIAKISRVITYISIRNIKSTLLVGSLRSMSTNEGVKIGEQLLILRSSPRQSVFSNSSLFIYIHIYTYIYVNMTVLWSSLKVPCSSTCTSDARNIFGLFGRGVGVTVRFWFGMFLTTRVFYRSTPNSNADP